MIEFNLEDWVQVGEGGNGKTYASKSDENILLKVNNGKQGRLDFVQTEYEHTKSVLDLGINAPMQYDIVKVGDQYGIIYQKIKNKKSLCRICADDPSRIDEMAALFSEQGKILHSIPCTPSYGRKSIKWRVEDGLKKFRFLLSPKKKRIIRSWLAEMPDVEYSIHGDFNPGNLIVSEGKPYWIDLGRFTCGDPNIDYAQLYFMCVLVSHMKQVQEITHMTEAQLKAFWAAFVKAEGIEDVPAFESKIRRYVVLNNIARQSYQPELPVRLFLLGIFNEIFHEQSK